MSSVPSGITIDEMFKSRNRTDSYTYTATADEYLYVLRGSDDDDDLQTAIGATAPLLLRNLVLYSTEIDQVGSQLWLGRARYQPPNVLDVGQTRFSFNTAGGTQHIVHSTQTVNAYGINSSVDPTIFGGLINVSTDDVQGVDITVPVYEWEETHVLANSTMTTAYLGLLYSLTGKVCNAPFKGGQEGEILFLGAGGGQRPDTKWEVTYKLAGSPNTPAGGITLGQITGIQKKGWEYLWAYYTAQSVTIGSDTFSVQQPKYAFVEQVYPEADLSQLGIGTTLPNP